jgi:serine/threonine-protein kinase/endoribonuclease IRE1
MRAVVQRDEEERPALSTTAKQSADIFAAGVLIFWCLTAGRHPFGEEPSQRRANVLRGDASALSMLRKLPEAQHLVSRMLAPEAEARLQAAQAKTHPALWEDERKLLFVRCVSDEPELTDESCAFVTRLEERGPAIFGNDGWGVRLHAELLAVLVAHRSYQHGSVRDLLRAVRNCDHLQGMPPEVQRLLLPRPVGIANYFLPRFPALFWTLYAPAEQHWPDRPQPRAAPSSQGHPRSRPCSAIVHRVARCRRGRARRAVLSVAPTRAVR